ncbi:hypothetical protein NHX12_018802 [Muraenolepis orangiensis]|uniref:Programmed cell death protein 4 n=1 Tax=Muraenolepis orangiensis TaxID=630683 RepID=A0A9Q0IXW2_9TELE|nr:hypothetical protein NHX12_018802 [Muraenolepis orangiensis]
MRGLLIIVIVIVGPGAVDSLQSGEEENDKIDNATNYELDEPLLSSASNIQKARQKAKRRVRKKSSLDSERGDALSAGGELSRRSGLVPTGRERKLMDRRSCLDQDRCRPKKGGAGGKGVWGRSEEVYEPEQDDTKDPNYDGDQSDFGKIVTPILQDYFEHRDTNEVVELLGELHLGPMLSGVPMLAVSLALEAKASHRELTSRLLVVLCGPVLTLGDLESGFDKLLCELPDQLLDTPGAPQLVGQFIARAVKDQILPKSYIEGYKGRVDCEHARAALDRAAVLLRMRMGGLRVDTMWGFDACQRSVPALIKEMNLLLKEYLLSGDRKEVESGLRELEMPHFLHEFVYEALVMVLESKREKTFKMVLQLLKDLWASAVITAYQMRRVGGHLR